MTSSPRLPSEKSVRATYNRFLLLLAVLTAATWVMGLLLPPSRMTIPAVVLGGAWVLWMLSVCRFLYDCGHRRWLLVLAIITGALVVGICLPRHLIDPMLIPFNRIIEWCHAQFPHLGFFRKAAGKVAHSIVFAVLALVTLWNRNGLQISWWQWLALFGMMALATEGMQLFVGGRATRIEDVGWDASGLGIGLALYGLSLPLIRVLDRRRTAPAGNV